MSDGFKMSDEINECGIGHDSISDVDGCGIEEKDPENIQFFKDHIKYNGEISIHYELGKMLDGKIFMRCQTNIEGRHFHYNCRPNLNWLRLLCQTGRIAITDIKDSNILMAFTIDVEILKKELSQIPECKDWISGEFE